MSNTETGNNEAPVKSKDAYVPLSKEKYENRARSLISLWEQFLVSHQIENTNYHLHEYNLYEVITRHDKRKHYFEVFHELSSPCEYKYIAVECFWINTLKPFIITDAESPIYNCPNEMFSLYLILATIRGVFETLNPGEEFKYPSKARMKDILYDFKFCTLSREAMISFVETLADNYGVGISYVLEHRGTKLKVPSEIANLWQD